MKISRSKTPVIVLIAILVILVILGLYLGIRQFSSNSGKSNIVALPPVKTFLNSSSSGKSHSLDATFSLDVVKFKNKNIDQDALYNKINAAVSSLDYDLVAGQDGTKYIKDEIAKSISEFVDPEDLKAIYITDVVSDAKLQQDAPVDAKNNKKSDSFKGIFKNSK